MLPINRRIARASWRIIVSIFLSASFALAGAEVAQRGVAATNVILSEAKDQLVNQREKQILRYAQNDRLAKPWQNTRSYDLATQPGDGQNFSAIRRYISAGWTTLTRSMTECATLYDPKLPGASDLYFPAGFAIPADVQRLSQSCPVHIKHLPRILQHLGGPAVQPAGLLYLPHPYVVPGGMFNEMYGWDSYFILRGLLQAGKLDLARGIVENFFFEIEHYGAILNANRTYYLTRSQPPFLSEMVRAVDDVEKSRGRDDRAWLEEAYPFVVKTDEFWTQQPNLAGATGLSRYFDFGQGPAPELGKSSDAYYRHAASYFVAHPGAAMGYLARVRAPYTPHNILGTLFPVYICDSEIAKTGGDFAGSNGCEQVEKVGLTSAFYKGDRSLRESGFDITFKFGPFGNATDDYAAAGLNCLLYREEKDLEWMSHELGKSADVRRWSDLARLRRERIDHYFWNPQRGLYFDYNFKTGKQSDYVYATTFYPLWAGASSQAQAGAVIKNLKLFEEPGGIVMSRRRSGGQWDYPYGWAPIQLIAVEGLRRYGDRADARHISGEFLSMVNENFLRDHTIREKYNVVTRSSETHVRVGYAKNQVGFGWTNGVFVTLLQSRLEQPRD